MSYTVYTWEDIEEAKDKFEDAFYDFNEKIDDLLWDVEYFCNGDFEGLYKSEKFYEDIHFDCFCEDYIRTFESMIEKLNKAIKEMKQHLEDYKEHRSH